MPRPASNRIKDLEKHYNAWVGRHPGAISYTKLIHYFDHGDEFGRPVPDEILAGLCKTSRHTIIKWRGVREAEKQVGAGQ